MMSYLTEAEIDLLTRPLTQNAAKVKRLRAMGFKVMVATDGSPLILRSHHDAIMGGIPEPLAANDSSQAGPDEAALAIFSANQLKSQHGPAQKR